MSERRPPIDPDDLDRILPPPAPSRRRARTPRTAAVARADEAADEPPVRLDEPGLTVWRGRRLVKRRDGSGKVDRSTSLVRLAEVLYDAGASEATIAAAVAARDLALFAATDDGPKYAHRRNAAACYRDLAADVAAKRADAPRPRPATCAQALAAKDAEIAELQRQLLELRALHSALVAAEHSPRLGPERQTATALVNDLATVPTNEWKPMPHKRLATDAGISPRAVPRHLEKIKPVLAEVVETKTEWVPETVDRETGEIHPGYRLTYARLTTDRLAALRVIAAATPTNGKHKNGHGGDQRGCPECGDAGVVRTVTDRCAGCGKVLAEAKTRIKPGNCQVVSIGPSPSPQTAEMPESRSCQPGVPSLSNGHSSTTLATTHNDGSAGTPAPLPADDELVQRRMPMLHPLATAVRTDEAPTGSIAAAWLGGQPMPSEPAPRQDPAVLPGDGDDTKPRSVDAVTKGPSS